MMRGYQPTSDKCQGIRGLPLRDPVDTRRNNNVIITSKRRRFDVKMTLLLHHLSVGMTRTISAWRNYRKCIFLWFLYRTQYGLSVRQGPMPQCWKKCYVGGVWVGSEQVLGEEEGTWHRKCATSGDINSGRTEYNLGNLKTCLHLLPILNTDTVV